MFPLLTPFPSLFSCHYASFLQTVFSTGCSIFLQETSCRTFGRAKFNLKNESNGGSLLVRPASTCVSIPCLSPSFFPPHCASHCASTGTSCRNCGKLGMHFKKWFGKHGSFLKGSEVLLQSSNSSSIISIPASQPKLSFPFHATTCKVPWRKNP